MKKIKLSPQDQLMPFKGLAEILGGGDMAEQLNWFIELRAAVNEGALAIRYPSGRLVRENTVGAAYGIPSPCLLASDIGDWLIKLGFSVSYVPVTAVKKTALQEDKDDVQKIAKELWNDNPRLTQTFISKHEKLKAYAKKYTGKNTLIDWIRAVDIMPRNSRIGRPKNSTSNK